LSKLSFRGSQFEESYMASLARRPTLLGTLVVLLAGVSVCEETPQVAKSSPRIVLDVLEPASRTQAVRRFPVSLGVVFEDDVLSSVPGGRLVDNRGRAVPFEAEATGWWDPERTRVKWLLLHFRADTDRRYVFEVGKKPELPQGEPIAVEKEGVVVIDTGVLVARMGKEHAALFDSVRLNGREMVRQPSPALVLVADDGETQWPGVVSEWRVELEESTPLRASVKAAALCEFPNGEPLARLELRYQFFRGETFVRLYHTTTWMVRDPKMGARELSLRLTPQLDVASVRLGPSEDGQVGDYRGDVVAYQDGPEHFRVTSDGEQVEEGERLAGWIAAEGGEGCGVGLALRHAWQTFPAALSLQDGQLRIKLWPDEAPRMGFEPQDLMPPDFFYGEHWNRFKWIKAGGHFIHEYSKNPHFVHTAEGAARTHEVTVFFYDRSSERTMAEINSVTQHPVVVRQDPKSAMRVPFMGLDIEPADERYPSMERAVEQIGRLAVGRWPATHDYGLWRFGMMRWGATGVSYRWFDGHQYDLQLIPWLLFMRGGGRRWYEEGEATARFAMDVATNHYNTRGVPPGYQSSAAAMPFPWHGHHLGKHVKVHFLAYYYHLTGYRRAKEVMDEVIGGAKWAAKHTPRPGSASAKPEYRRGWGRELYNVNVLWANAYEETWDPEVEAFAREWIGLTMNREYSAEMNVFRNPNIYLYPGLVLHQRLWPNGDLSEIMLRNLAGLGYPNLDMGGVYRAEDALACGWAYRQTEDPRFARVGWDIARTLADLVPDHDWTSAEVPRYPLNGNQLHRHFLGPIIVGYSLAARHGLEQSDEFLMRDTFISLPPLNKDTVRGTVFLRPKREGDLTVRIVLSGVWGASSPEMCVTALDATDRPVAAVTIPETERAATKDRYYPIAWRFNQRGTLTIPGARKGTTHRLLIEGRNERRPMALVLADADLVHQVSPGTTTFFYNLAGQYYVGTRIFTKTISDTVTVANPYVKPYTIRDAETGEALHHYSLTDPNVMTHRVGAGRMIRITMTGRMDGRRFEGLSPYLATTRESWFDPEDNG